MQISVLPDMSVEVVAPRSVSEAEILKNQQESRVDKPTDTIFSPVQSKNSRAAFLVGARPHLYLGRRYRLKVIRAVQTEIRLKSGYIEVRTPHPSRSDLVRNQVGEWFKLRANKRFEAPVRHLLGKIS